jgi:hypothetical protein
MDLRRNRFLGPAEAVNINTNDQEEADNRLSMTNLFAGGIIGLLASLGAWWLGASGLAPRMRFSPQISKLYDRKTPIYRVKFTRARPPWPHGKAIELEASAELVLQGLSRHAPRNTVRVVLPIRNPRLARMPAARIVRFRLEKLEDLDMLPAAIGAESRAGTLELEDLMALAPETAHLTVYVSASDSAMRARRVSEHTYKATDIVMGQFDANGLNVIPLKPGISGAPEPDAPPDGAEGDHP